MTACPLFEEQLLDYSELASLERQAVDAHLAGCAGCREYLRMLGEIDVALSTELGAVRLDPHRLADVRERIAAAVPVSRVSKLPEWLDFAAACAICVFGYTLATQTGLLAYVIYALSSPVD